MSIFTYPPSPQILQWLAGGQLANRMQRSLRLWALLTKLYGPQPNWAEELVAPFGYPDVRDRLFAPSHGKSDTLSAERLVATCGDRACICHRSMKAWIFTPESDRDEPEWRREIIQMTGLTPTELDKILQESPFATVHRSIREDLKQLVEMGWLQTATKGRYQCLPLQQLPTPPNTLFNEGLGANFSFNDRLNTSRICELLRVLESVSFVQPNLELIIQFLWEKLPNDLSSTNNLKKQPTQRIFLHLDYILSAEMQDRVDTYQEQLEQLWRHPPAGIVQFEYWLREGYKVEIIVYPVCLHYLRRAKYLSAFGLDPKGTITWHNYRLDRIASYKLKVLAWGDPSIPKALQNLRRAGELPTTEQIQIELEAAWGFNFYLPSELLIIRFSEAFARWYVDNTMRHKTFKRVSYKKLPKLINNCVSKSEERQQLLQIIEERSPDDAYYRAWIRSGDVNVLMRLREWRPNGEVIAPLSIRKQLAFEAEQEMKNYRS